MLTNCVHSLWTGTPMFKLRRGPLLIHTLSLCLALEWFPRVEFVTDFRGLKLCDTLGWEYTSHLTSLEKLKEESGVSKIWALGKAYALAVQHQPTVQIDTDVLLFRPLSAKILQSRVIAQSLDHPHYYLGGAMLEARRTAGLVEDHVAYNAGVIGFNDVHIMHEYARRVIATSRNFVDSPINGTAISMVIEQYQLGVVAREHSVRVDTVIGIDPVLGEHRRYRHLQGPLKDDPKEVAICERTLKTRFPGAYKRFLSGWARLERTLLAEPVTPTTPPWISTTPSPQNSSSHCPGPENDELPWNRALPPQG